MKLYKELVPDLETRRKDAESFIRSHNDRIPVIIEPYKDSLYVLDQKRFLVPRLYTFHEFVFHIRRKIQLSKADGLYIIVGPNCFPAMNRTMHSIYNEFKDPDGFLYMTYSSQPVWGSD